MKQRFQIVKNIKIFSIISAVLVSVGLVGIILLPFGTNLFNLDIDFIGGTKMHFDLQIDVTSSDLDDVSAIFEQITGEAVSSIQISDTTEVIVNTKDIPTETRAAIIEEIESVYGIGDDQILTVENVSAKVGADLQNAAVVSAVLASILMLIYITIRFEFTSGLAAVICLVHDILVMLSAYIILQIPLNLNFIAAALTILGYSINAGIIVFDRVRENKRLAKREGFDEIVEKSLWQTMGRTINTTITTLLPVVMIYILGVDSLKNFTLPLMIGIVSGAYSSICLSGSLWVVLKNKFAQMKAKKA